MRNYYLARKNDPEYIERQWLSSKTHYYKHKEEVLERMKRYKQNKLELARIEALHDLQQERSIDLMTVIFHKKIMINYNKKLMTN